MEAGTSSGKSSGRLPASENQIPPPWFRPAVPGRRAWFGDGRSGNTAIWRRMESASVRRVRAVRHQIPTRRCRLPAMKAIFRVIPRTSFVDSTARWPGNKKIGDLIGLFREEEGLSFPWFVRLDPGCSLRVSAAVYVYLYNASDFSPGFPTEASVFFSLFCPVRQFFAPRATEAAVFLCGGDNFFLTNLDFDWRRINKIVLTKMRSLELAARDARHLALRRPVFDPQDREDGRRAACAGRRGTF